MKPDILGRADIERLINAFYDKVRMDPEISFLFMHVNWEKHLPVMYDFWENALFFTGAYKGNPLQVHLALHKRTGLKDEQFKQWLNLFQLTVDELFGGEKAGLAKLTAVNIATIMQIKIFGERSEKPAEDGMPYNS